MLSPIVSLDGWIQIPNGLCQKSAFEAVLQRFGPFDIDLFASALNAKCDIYVSWLPDPGFLTINAFTLSWERVFFYAFPPFILLTRM